MKKDKHDEWYFTGVGPTYGTFGAGAALEVESVEPYITRLLSSDVLADPSLIYIQGSVNYNGIKEVARDSGIGMEIYSKYVAETLAGTETWKTMITYDNIVQGKLVAGSPFEFLGFEVTLSAASATSENLTVTIDSARGAAWANLIYSKDMDTVKHINYMFDEIRYCGPGDKIDIAWANSDDRTWGIKIFTRALI